MKKNVLEITRLLFASMLILVLNQSAVHAANGIGLPIYFGFGLSQSDSELNKSNTVAVNSLGDGSSFVNDGFGMNLFMGYELDDHLSLEIGYVDQGTFQLDDGNSKQVYFDTDVVYFDSVLNHTLGRRVNVFASVGVGAWAMESEDSSLNYEGYNLRYGAGMDINVYGPSSRILRISWNHQNYDDVVIEDSDTVSISMMFKF